jgi:beta-barrel assembly-enhancing protease
VKPVVKPAVKHSLLNNTRLKQAVMVAVSSGLLVAGNAWAFDLKGALKDAVSDQLGGNSKTGQPAASDNQNATTQEKSAQEKLANINWKNPSQEDEIAVGRNVTGTILGAASLVNDANLQQYVNKVGRWVASQSERTSLPWHFGVIDSSDVNAFAAPGGYVLITKGLYQRLNSEAQLAGVLGHEIAHIVQRHHLKVMQKQALMDAGSSFLKEKISKNKITQRALSTGAEISARNLDKSAEYEADSMGTVLAARAGYEAYGLAEVLQDMETLGSNDGSVALLFQTHPHPDDRVAQLSLVSGEQIDKLSGGKTLENRLYKLK